MTAIRIVLVVILSGGLATAVHASHHRGVDVSVDIDAASGAVLLTWTGGQPDFTISRSSDPRLVQVPGSEIGVTASSSWSDLPPSGGTLFFYDITGTCTPEVCDDIDNDCDGEVDEPGSEASCGPAGDTCLDGICSCGGQASCDTLFCTLGAACVGGACAGGTPRDCGVSPCTTATCNEATDTCHVACTMPNQPCWSSVVAGGAGSAPVSDSALSPPQGPSYQYVAKGAKLYALRNVQEGGAPPGSIAWEWTAPASIPNPPHPVPADPGGSGAAFLFAGSEDGFLYKIDASNGAVADSVDTRRPVCPSDRLTVTPAVQLYQLSNAAFRSNVDATPGHAGDDLVIVATNNGCGDSTHNRIIAYWASDLTQKWIFNPTGSRLVDAISEGCSIDYQNNQVICGTRLDAVSLQDSLWTVATTTGALRWSTNAGSILNRPILKAGPHGPRLYVANTGGVVECFHPTSGLRLWTSPMMLPAGVSRNMIVPDSPGTVIFLVDDARVLRTVIDNGSAGMLWWMVTPVSGSSFATEPVFDPGSGRVFVGRDDGKVQQVSASGALEGAVNAAESLDLIVFEPSLDAVGGSAVANRLTVSGGVTSTGSRVKQFCMPFSTVPPPAGVTESSSPAPPAAPQ
ncbi:MAG: hypothetical protein ACREAA_01745 [Candidatus Polarisedimenticolia bacterium]